MLLDRRQLITGGIGFIAAPFVVRVSNALMPVRNRELVNVARRELGQYSEAAIEDVIITAMLYEKFGAFRDIPKNLVERSLKTSPAINR